MADSSCTAHEGPLQKFELDVLECPLVAACKLSELKLRPVSTQPGFEELLDPPSFTSPERAVPAIGPLLSSARQSRGESELVHG